MAGARQAGRAAALRLTLSKISNVAVVVATRRAGSTSIVNEQLGHGTRLLGWTPRTPGRYAITVSATDLAGNIARTGVAVTVAAAPARHKHR